MLMVHNSRARLVFLVFAVLLVASGCTEEEETPFFPGPEDNIPDSALPFPDTPEQLMANFREIYEAMDVDEFGLILDPGFETILQDNTIIEFPHMGLTLDVAEENRIHERMFSGEDLTGHGGDFIPAIINLSFDEFRAVVDWGVSLPTDPIPNTLSSLYEVDILVDRGQIFSSFRIVGQIRFYVTTAEGNLNGQPKTYYRMVGQLDLTLSEKGAGNTSWGSLKAWFH